MSKWLPDKVAFALADPTQTYPLLGSEQDAVSGAVEKRSREFSAGRAAARRALGELGFDEVEIPVGPRRAPVWPDDICGSITHSKRLCIAAVARRNDWLSIGIDAEPDFPLKDNLRSAILHKSEENLSASQAIAVFSMKEALFKTLFPITQEWMGFHDAAQIREGVLQLTKQVGKFEAGTTFDIPTRRLEDHVISFCCMKGAV